MAPIGLMYVPGKLFVRGDAQATAMRILGGQALFRAGIVSGLAAAVISIFLALALYRLFEGVDQRRAVLMVILSVVQVPIAFLNEVSQLGALMLLRGGEFQPVFDKAQREALALLFLNLHGQGIIVSEIFWGLWLLPFGLLVYRSGFIPRLLGMWLIVNGVAYVAIALTGLLLPEYSRAVSNVLFPVLLGEMAIMLWLVTVGARGAGLKAATE